MSSVGGVLGAVAGGVIGFYMGGPYGALYGASIGGGLGMMIDPAKPATPDVARPDTADLQAPTCKEGQPIADFVGVSQMSGNIFWYAGQRTEEILETQGGGGKGGGPDETTYVSGYKYYLSFAIGFSLGPVDEIYCIFENDNLLWDSGGDSSAGGLKRDDAVNGKVTISVEDRGNISFYFGTDDQTANSVMADATGYDIPYRGLCYAVFEDFMIGENMNRVGAFKFVMRKAPEINSGSIERIGAFDYNPILAIQYILQNGIDLEDNVIDFDSFDTAATVIDDEERGVSASFLRDSSALDYIESILSHCRGCLHVTSEGKIAVRLYRADVNIEDMLVINEDDILEDADVDRKNLSDTKNEVVGDYSKIEVSEEAS